MERENVLASSFGALEPEVLGCVHKLQESWHGKSELVEDVDTELLEAWGGDPMNNCFQVSSNTVEPKTAKIRTARSVIKSRY